jgi:predicted O-linked N-acetylglucosamine transferase (SPINDLY family)
MATLAQAFEIALTHHQAGRLAAAEEIYRRILAVEPQHADSLQLLGVIAHQTGQHATAVDLIQRAIALRPDVAVYHGNLGEAYRLLGKNAEALACYQRAIELNAAYPEALNGMGLVFKELGRFDEAVTCYRRTLTIKPDYAEAHSNLGVAIQAQGQLDQAVACFQRALQLNPDLHVAHSNLGGVLHAMGRYDEAIACYRRTLERNPHVAETHASLGAALRERGNVDDAIACHRQAISLKPMSGWAHNNLGVALKECGELDEALACHRRAIELSPDASDLHSNLLYTLHFSDAYDARAIHEEHRRWSERHAAPLEAAIRPHRNDRSPERRLRVGYVSPDFQVHPIGRFLLPLVEAHDHRELEIYCYSSVRSPDTITERCQAAADVWRPTLGLSDPQLADAIRADQIDVLVDLTMHMARNRMLVFARRPAPVQVTYLAYCSTTGLKSIDYRITDPYIDPPGCDESVYSERSVRLPETYWCYRPHCPMPEATPLPARQTGQVTFGSLNNFCKMTVPTLTAWCRLLAAVPNSRLLLHARPGSHRDRVRRLLAEHGVDPQRVDFADLAPMSAYLRLYQQIDIALDPFPYGGGTTTCDALWLGVPVVSLAGQTGVGRGGLSILSNVGLPELVARSVDDYVRIAADLAGDLARVADLRATMTARLQSSPLADTARFARHIENAYRQMWQHWCEYGPS